MLDFLINTVRVSYGNCRSGIICGVNKMKALNKSQVVDFRSILLIFSGGLF